MGKVRVAVDVGGTFTDICILDEDGGAIEVPNAIVPWYPFVRLTTWSRFG